ncbi:hypothetical protein BU17DRAFT_45362, partial [Hysterangium stoloniferum]
SHALMEASHKEIYQSIIDLIVAHENIEINGGDDVDEDIPIEPHPTQCDVLKAISTINRYIDDRNDPITCKFEAILGSFKWQLCLEAMVSLKEIVITDFLKS